MRFGETRDPAPTTMEELAPGGLLARLSQMDVVARRAVRGARSGEGRSRKTHRELKSSPCELCCMSHRAHAKQPLDIIFSLVVFLLSLSL